jgi:hypothetical protein
LVDYWYLDHKHPTDTHLQSHDGPCPKVYSRLDVNAYISILSDHRNLEKAISLRTIDNSNRNP